MNVSTKLDPWGLLLKHEITWHTEWTMIIKAHCDCGSTRDFEIFTADYVNWLNGTLVQIAFPDLTPERREWLFISGTCPVCWDTMWGDYVEEDFDFDDEA
jgi:hypothetical protein